MGGWVGGWVGGWCTSSRRRGMVQMSGLARVVDCVEWVGGWVGGWVDEEHGGRQVGRERDNEE